MYYIGMLGLLMVGFFIITGIGKVVLEMYVKGKVGQTTARVLSRLSLVSWYIFAYTVIVLMAFNFNSWAGWIVAIIFGLGMLKALGNVSRDNLHTMSLYNQRRTEHLHK